MPPPPALSGPHAALPVGGQNLTYDANGNLLSGPNLGGSGTRSFTWNADNQPTSITSGGVTEQYVYDADGERISRTRGGVTTYYLGGLAEVDGSNGTVRHLYTFNGQVVAQRELIVGKTNTLLYLHGDHLGSVSLATDSAGAVASSQEFKPWGEVRSGSVAQTTRTYTGQQLDGTGLLYYHARYYDPVLARFVSADDDVANRFQPQALNRYRKAYPVVKTTRGRFLK